MSIVFFSNQDMNKLFEGSVKGTELRIVEQNPNIKKSNTIVRSINENDGIEFTWSLWIYIENLSINENNYKCIFYKGNTFKDATDYQNSNIIEKGLNYPNNAPGVYLAPNKNDLIVFMNTFNNIIDEKITVQDIPLQKWVNIMIRLENRTIDIYINGTIIKSHLLQGVPKQNYSQVWIAPNGGFGGFISNLWYYPYSLSGSEIEKIVKEGPNTSLIGSNGYNDKTTDYLSLRWFFYGENIRTDESTDITAPPAYSSLI